MKTLYLHIGLSKTGTSALQIAFAQNKGTLRNHGVHYPAWAIEDAIKGKITSGNGLKIAEFLNPNLGFNFPMDNIQNEIEHELNFGFQSVLFSSEFLNGFDIQKMKVLNEITHNKDYQIKVIAYVRDVVPLYESLYGQKVKRGLYQYSYENFIASETVNQYLILEKYINFLGKQNVIVKKYCEKFNSSDLINSFFSIFDAKFDILKDDFIFPNIINPALLPNNLGIMCKVNGFLQNFAQAELLSNYLIQIQDSKYSHTYLSTESDSNVILNRHKNEIHTINKLIDDENKLDFFTKRNSSYFSESSQDTIENFAKTLSHFVISTDKKNRENVSLSNAESDINLIFPIGHFYSPIANPIDIRSREKQIWKQFDSMSGIDLNIQKQFDLLEKLKPYVSSINYSEEKIDEKTYFYKNDQYPVLDAEFLYCLLCFFKPKNMIEIGSGFSSLVTADVNKRILNNSINFSCIEPYPRQFLVDGVDGITRLIVQKVEDVELDFFDQLNSGDVLFIDSSHVSKVGSDVNFLFFEVIPRLKVGVMVHIHDIFIPDEYPKGWVIEQGRNWNEQYLLRAFLQFNSNWEIMWSTCFMATRYTEIVRDVFPRYPNLGGGGSFWIKRIN